MYVSQVDFSITYLKINDNLLICTYYHTGTDIIQIFILLCLFRCDADPAALAKYVLALIKKDKPKDELKESMVQQMDVFLQSETNSFIDMLFTVVEAKEYLEQEPETEPQPQETKLTAQQVQAKAELEAVEAKIEAVADSTTPIREEKTAQEERKPRYRSPPRDRRLASRLGTVGKGVSSSH